MSEEHVAYRRPSRVARGRIHKDDARDETRYGHSSTIISRRCIFGTRVLNANVVATVAVNLRLIYGERVVHFSHRKNNDANQSNRYLIARLINIGRN